MNATWYTGNNTFRQNIYTARFCIINKIIRYQILIPELERSLTRLATVARCNDYSTKLYHYRCTWLKPGKPINF